MSILNRVAEVPPDGSWRINNLPTGIGLVRARFTCVENGATLTGQSGFFEILPNQGNGFESEFTLGGVDPVPVSVSVAANPAILTAVGETTQVVVTATLPDESLIEVTFATDGTTYSTSNPSIATVSLDGLVTAVSSGQALISAMNENVLGSIFITVSFSGDSDGDGIPDDVELALGLDPNNPVDAVDDADQDGLITLDEIAFGTDIFVADTDDDGVPDGAEVAAATDPLDPESVNYAGFLESIEVIPPIVTLRANAILPAEVTRQLQVLGVLEDGRVVDATAFARGTTYTSSNLLVVNFGATDGLLFAGQPGSAMVTVSNGDVSVDVPVEVTLFQPVALGFVQIPGQANAVDTVGSHAYIAAGAAGFRVVDVSNPTTPTIVGVLDTPGNGNDVSVSGPFAYLADGSAGLKVIDITDPTHPSLLGSVDTPGNASGVAACGQLVYVADGSAGLQVINVSDPTLPFIVGSVDTPGLANGVAVDELRQLAMVADDTPGLKVIDISISAAPSIIGSVDTVDAFDVTLDGVFAYVADGNASSNPGGLVAVDTTVPTAPVITGSTPPPGFYTDVVTFGGVALCADVISVNSVHAFVLSNPPTPAPSLLINFGGAPSFRDDNGTGIDAEAGFVYMTGTQGIAHLGCCRNGGLHIGRFFELVDDLGVPPTVAIVSPAAGDEFFEGSTITVEATASDDIQVAGVQFFADGEFFATDTVAPFVAFVVAPGGAPSVNLSVRAFDLGNNLSDFAAVDVVVISDPPPTVTITAPADADTVIEGETITLAADALDNVEVVRVDFSTDTGFMQSDFDPPYEVLFTVPLGITQLTVNASAFDNLSKEGVAEPVTVNVIPDPLTTVVGSVVDPDGLPVEGATLTTNGDLTGTSLPNGTFSIPDVPTILGDIVVEAAATIDDVDLTGRSDPLPPVRAGTTDIGLIHVSASVEACCFSDGSCQDVSDPDDCQAAGGTALGSGTECGTTVCSRTGETLGLFRKVTINGNYVAAGVGLRLQTSGTITISGIPDSASVFAAYLYWGMLDNGESASLKNMNFSGVPVTGTLLLSGPDTCWGRQNSFAYRANVTEFVFGNGAYQLSGAASGGAILAQGASLIVLYENPGDPPTTIVVMDGNVVFRTTAASATTVIDGFTATAPVSAKTTFVVGDGQFFTETASFTGTAGSCTFTNPFAGGDGPLWDTDTFDVSAEVGPDSELASANITIISDCLMWVAQVFSVSGG